jgi:sialate O-acetylesterase
MAIINDIGTPNNIHPPNKVDVGERLARWALAKDYGKSDVVISGPIYKGSKVDGGKMRIEFDHAKGLKSRDGGPLKRFEIAGADQKWVWADAVVNGDVVVVSSNEVPKPVAVRYAWASNPEGANLVNGEGLPASLFRTDDWKLKTER